MTVHPSKVLAEQSCPNHSLDLAAVELASESDRKFFEAHPDRHYRVRPARDGEMPGLVTPTAGWAMIAVKHIAPGIRARFPFVAKDLPPDTDALARLVIGTHLNNGSDAPSSAGDVE